MLPNQVNIFELTSIKGRSVIRKVEYAVSVCRCSGDHNNSNLYEAHTVPTLY